jgi:steroid 5-alpha reductase family enzyme
MHRELCEFRQFCRYVYPTVKEAILVCVCVCVCVWALVNSELEKMWKEAIMTEFDILLRLLRGTVDNHRELRIIIIIIIWFVRLLALRPLLVCCGSLG